MTVVVPNIGEDIILQLLLSTGISPVDLTMRLFSNNITPSETDVRSDYTEATFSGYSAHLMVGATDWIITQGNPTVAVGLEQVFQKGPPPPAETIFGYIMTRGPGQTLIWAERFTNGPYTVTSGGDEIRVVPRFTGE